MPYFPPDGGGGGGGGGTGHPVSGEIPTGTINGINTTFTISRTPIVNTLKIFYNGVRQNENVDFTFVGVTITFSVPPELGDTLLVDYNYVLL